MELALDLAGCTHLECAETELGAEIGGDAYFRPVLGGGWSSQKLLWLCGPLRYVGVLRQDAFA